MILAIVAAEKSTRSVTWMPISAVAPGFGNRMEARNGADFDPAFTIPVITLSRVLRADENRVAVILKIHAAGGLFVS